MVSMILWPSDGWENPKFLSLYFSFSSRRLDLIQKVAFGHRTILLASQSTALIPHDLSQDDYYRSGFFVHALVDP